MQYIDCSTGLDVRWKGPSSKSFGLLRHLHTNELGILPPLHRVLKRKILEVTYTTRVLCAFEQAFCILLA
jgi:hypothetical protein